MSKPKAKLPKKVIAYLEKAGVPHKILEHKTVYTAYDAAQTLSKKLGEVAKSLLVKADKDYYVVVLPADRQVDFNKLGKCLTGAYGKKAKTIKIPGEKIVQEILKLKNETVSAFGQLHKVPVVVEKELVKLKKAIFASGGFNHSIEMAVKDFMKMEGAKAGSFGVRRKAKVKSKI
ncbi:hypothetical protein A3G56_02090 [Candidatus Falkowbacteria bacterium RIFCSPLOWO2_12_FULL_45_10]|uniref:YbaK/aminoacyl-tRNA synthetase-associated domain-containing protein n=3 Tax=Candidatus Falkowiibacteriota TaxID=1752728 RepID=A0A1F5RZ45_9BACT|nr:MAG: hypothetical protein A3I35_00350 [Candidatus Falkowbacteria bacterium RIFCSPLOWO2_02_FULL_45_15]OGF19710.1 MAG: hypothetical protein A3D54_02270 [Candidatus Falkowbacteria bacterium RIFCSPHIGHO2_02_FULL_45_15]OGF19935.1 MAG: hypothetical protein A3G56_02090 [Candidatus Falkowbacteria bacterium RIFCSPLOWO2_12_FULL_45_10]